MGSEARKTTVLYSANFVLICPNCHREQLHTVGRKNTVWTCRSCDRQYHIDLAIRLTDDQGNAFE